MSLILDALRKSEAERRKAALAQGALTDVPRLPASSLAGVPAWIWPAAAFAMLALAAAAWLLLAPLARTDVPSPAMDTTAPSAEEMPAPALGPQPADVRPAKPAGDNRAVATVAQATAPVAAAAPAFPGASVTSPAQAPATLASPASQPSLAGTVPAPDAPNPILDTTPSPPTARTSTPAIPSRETVEPAAPDLPARPAPGNGPMRLSDLSTTDRQQLPPLKMSMHMWGPDPAQRFAIIDGTRVGEGDRIGETVVEAIDQDGVVLAWNGLRLRVPVR